MFAGMESKEKDPRLSIKIDQVAVPELAPGEALIAVMASSINYNTVWTSIFEPVSTFGFLARYAKAHPDGVRHDLPHQVIGSDAVNEATTEQELREQIRRALEQDGEGESEGSNDEARARTLENLSRQADVGDEIQDEVQEEAPRKGLTSRIMKLFSSNAG